MVWKCLDTRHAAGLRSTSTRVGLFVLWLVGCPIEASSEPESERLKSTDFYAASLDSRLRRAVDVLRTRGFDSDAPILRTFLVERDAHVHDATLSRGRCYVFAGVATDAVEQLSIRVFDSDGARAVEEHSLGAATAAFFCPSDSGRYFVALTASRGNGLLAFRRLSGPTGLTLRVDDIFRPREQEGRPGSVQ
ncbi:MAG: hypothetical protein AAF355_15925 [Myxococcota bacterium]